MFSIWGRGGGRDYHVLIVIFNRSCTPCISKWVQSPFWEALGKSTDVMLLCHFWHSSTQQLLKAQLPSVVSFSLRCFSGLRSECSCFSIFSGPTQPVTFGVICPQTGWFKMSNVSLWRLTQKLMKKLMLTANAVFVFECYQLKTLQLPSAFSTCSYTAWDIKSPVMWKTVFYYKREISHRKGVRRTMRLAHIKTFRIITIEHRYVAGQ